MFRSQSALFIVALAAFGSACIGEETQYCSDVSANATILELAYSENDNMAYISLYHSLSLCTGTDERRYAIELIEIDLSTATFTTQHKTADELDMFEIPVGADPVFRGEFGNNQLCADCEFRLSPTDDSSYSFLFLAPPAGSPSAMMLHVQDAGVDMLVIEIGGYESVPAGQNR